MLRHLMIFSIADIDLEQNTNKKYNKIYVWSN